MNSSTFVSVSAEASLRSTLTLVIFSVLAIIMIVEGCFAYRDEHPQKVVTWSYITNLCLMVFGDMVLSLLSVSSLLAVAGEYVGFGLLGGTFGIGQAVVSLVLFDLMLYFWHRERHRQPLLWKLHQTHHSDLVVNVTTAFRLHFVETFLTTCVKAVFVVMVGVDGKLVLLNEVIVVFCAMFHHWNFSFRWEKWVGYFMVVPYVHRAHHSTKPKEHHRNFGTVFSFWDRWFGTLAETEPNEVGLKHLGEQNFPDVLLLRTKTQKE